MMKISRLRDKLSFLAQLRFREGIRESKHTFFNLSCTRNRQSEYPFLSIDSPENQLKNQQNNLFIDASNDKKSHENNSEKNVHSNPNEEKLSSDKHQKDEKVNEDKKKDKNEDEDDDSSDDDSSKGSLLIPLIKKLILH